jgi:pyruvate dehydrogenase (quinone)/pyruvate oxidase
LFIDVAVFNERVMGASHVRKLTELAARTALARRGVAHLTIPVDIQDQELKDAEPSKRSVEGYVANVWAEGARIPNDQDLRRAADMLNAASKVAILAGQGALHAGDELEQVAELLGGPIAKALLGKACVPDDSPYTTGGIGLLGTAPSQEAMESCDALLIVGSSFPYIEFYPKPGQAKAVQIDRDAMRIGLRYPVDAGLVGDAREALRALIPLLRRKDDRSFHERAQKNMKDWLELMHTRATQPGKPMKPQVVAYEIGRRLPSNAIVTSDSGTITTWWARHIMSKRGQMHSCSGNLATMACGLPYAIAAQAAYPDRPVVAFVGDGAFSMLMAEMATCVKYKLPVKVFIVKNNYLGQIMWEQMVFLGNPEFACDLQPIDFAMVARACGAAGFSVEDPEHCGHIVEEALAHDGPAVVEAIVDPYIPPMPGKISMEQALHFAESIIRGTPDRGKIIQSIVGEKIRELV